MEGSCKDKGKVGKRKRKHKIAEEEFTRMLKQLCKLANELGELEENRKKEYSICNEECVNLFNAYNLGPRSLSYAYIYAIGLGPRPLHIFSLDKDSM